MQPSLTFAPLFPLRALLGVVRVSASTSQHTICSLSYFHKMYLSSESPQSCRFDGRER